MVNLRQAKVDKIADYIPEQKLDNGPEKGKVLVLGWGSTYGAIKALWLNCSLKAIPQFRMRISVISAPSPGISGIYSGILIRCLVPEINNGQLVKIIRDHYFVDAIPHNKVMGIPITKAELVEKVKSLL